MVSMSSLTEDATFVRVDQLSNLDWGLTISLFELKYKKGKK